LFNSRLSRVGRRPTHRPRTPLRPVVQPAQRAGKSRAARRHAGPQAAQLGGPEALGLGQQCLQRNAPAIPEFNRMPVVWHPSPAVYHDDLLIDGRVLPFRIRYDTMGFEQIYCNAAKRSPHGKSCHN
jgi:hypothetical protein